MNYIEPHTHGFQLGDWKMSDHYGSWTIECCDVGMIKDTREEVVVAWNKRADTSAIAADRAKRNGPASAAQIHDRLKQSWSTPRQRINLRKAASAERAKVIEEAIRILRGKIRETPAWAKGYNSAISTLELLAKDEK